MKTITEQPDTNFAELRGKVNRLTKITQAKKEELLKKQQEYKVATEKKEREIHLDNIYTKGKGLAMRLQGTYDCLTEQDTVDISGFEKESIKSTENYIAWLEDAFMGLQDQFKERKESIYNPQKEKKEKWHPPIRSRLTWEDDEPRGRTCGNEGLPRIPQYFEDRPGYYEVVAMKGDELNNLRKIQKEELKQLTGEINALAISLHSHMQGFIDAMLKSDRHILDAVKVAMVANVDNFREFGGRQKVLEYLKTTTVDKIEEKLATGTDIDEAGIKEIERILNEIRKAVGKTVE